MSSTYSSSLRIELIGTGDQAGAWGTTTDNNFAYLLDAAIAGYQTVTVSSTSQALTYTNGATSSASLNQSVYAMIRFAGASAASSIYAPPISKQYVVWNNSGYTITVYNSTVIGNTTAAGTGVAISDGAKIIIFSDGTNFYKTDIGNTGTVTSVSVSGGTTGLTTSGGPVTTSGTITLAGTLGTANGGTNSTSTPTAGGAAYGTGSAYATTAAGTSGQFLQSNGSSAPSWASINTAPFPTGTLMLFQQTAAPTGWTKQTTHNDKTLRIVSGTASSGGTTAFSTVFTNQTPTITTSGLSADATTLSQTQIPSHTHTLPNWVGGSGGTGQNSASGTAGNTGATGGGGSHTHTIAGSATSSAITLNVQYVDLIIASKD